MRLKFSNFFNPNFFHDEICESFDMPLLGGNLHKFTFHDNFARFSYVHGLQPDIRNHANHVPSIARVQSMSSKFALFDLYMYQNK